MMPAVAGVSDVSPFRLKRDAKDEPIVFDDVRPDLCPQLAEIILRRSATERSTPSLNRGGWKSSEGLFRWIEPAIAELEGALTKLFGARSVAWAMVNRGGSGHPRHQHRIAIVTGIYYVTAGDPVVPTIFECPNKDTFEVPPVPGRLVVCPGDMWHLVPPYPGSEPRITIVCDVRR